MSKEERYQMSEDALQDFFSAVGTDRDRNRDLFTKNAGMPDSPPTPIHVGSAAVSAWALGGDKYWGISQSLDRLPPGCYRTEHDGNLGLYLMKQALHTDTLLTLPDSRSEAILNDIEHFTTLRPAFDARGLLYKRGILLWGPPGSGKTSTLHLLMRLIIERHHGIALLVGHPKMAADAMEMIRKIEPQRQIIAILEDLDGLIANFSVEQYLSLLDGETQVDNVIFVATTNYPERLDKRLVDRPSRLDTVEYIGMPSEAARRAYLRLKEPALPEVSIDHMVQVSEGLSIAHLRELIILTQCFGRSIQEAGDRLNAGHRRPPNSERSPDHATTGFSSR